MPIFDNKITFIHIPKCAGTSIEKFFLNSNSKISFLSKTGHRLINGHTPQHCTFRELKNLGVLTDKIFTVVRPHIDRTISEYFFVKQKRPDIFKQFSSFDGFLDLFLNHNNTILFDNHNLSNSDFLIDDNGFVHNNIKIFKFYDIKGIENFLNIKGLDKIHEFNFNNEKEKFLLETYQKERILNFFKTDL